MSQSSTGPLARHQRMLRLAIEEAERHTRSGAGGPFGAVVARGDDVIAVGWNEVTSRNDPTAHAEVQAIRAACAALGTFQLSGCELYASCEPCPMCLGAVYWARPSGVFFAATRADAARAGFDDAFIYDQIAKPPESRQIPFQQVSLPDAERPFLAWASLPARVRY